MGELRQFRLPDVGEGLTEGEILQWLVSVGDTVVVNQPLCEVETAKAAVELPSPYAGTVTVGRTAVTRPESPRPSRRSATAAPVLTH